MPIGTRDTALNITDKFFVLVESEWPVKEVSHKQIYQWKIQL